jgi:N-methylhydantoinase A/oxoprolinase/acetone carboxylase beta subunit
MAKRIRIGIDVGGTFTKAIAINMDDGGVVGKITWWSIRRNFISFNFSNKRSKYKKF